MDKVALRVGCMLFAIKYAQIAKSIEPIHPVFVLFTIFFLLFFSFLTISSFKSSGIAFHSYNILFILEN